MSEAFYKVRPKLLKKLEAKQFDFEHRGINKADPQLGICPTDYEEAFKYGRFHNDKVMNNVTLIEGIDGGCHFNSYNLFSQGKVDKVCTGFVVANGVAFLHSWGLKDGGIVETIPSFIKLGGRYFGFIVTKEMMEDYLDEDESQFFQMAQNLGIPKKKINEIADTILKNYGWI